tara:strand:- start:614 stop:721 length:108 start_codon:yes stop_codon:yes gene_type:complete
MAKSFRFNPLALIFEANLTSDLPTPHLSNTKAAIH